MLSLGPWLSLFSEVSYVSQFLFYQLPQGLTRYFTLLFIQNICSTHLKYYVENKLKQTADAFDDHYDQTEVQSILA